METKLLNIGVSSSLYKAGTDEDGQDFIAEVYFLSAEAADGRTFRHDMQFAGAKKFSDDDCWGFEDVREEAMAKAERLLAKVKASDAINLDFWRESAPRYGSEAYCRMSGF